jgi:hypothetical protein
MDMKRAGWATLRPCLTYTPGRSAPWQPAEQDTPRVLNILVQRMVGAEPPAAHPLSLHRQVVPAWRCVQHGTAPAGLPWTTSAPLLPSYRHTQTAVQVAPGLILTSSSVDKAAPGPGASRQSLQCFAATHHTSCLGSCCCCQLMLHAHDTVYDFSDHTCCATRCFTPCRPPSLTAPCTMVSATPAPLAASGRRQAPASNSSCGSRAHQARIQR